MPELVMMTSCHDVLPCCFYVVTMVISDVVSVTVLSVGVRFVWCWMFNGSLSISIRDRSLMMAGGGATKQGGGQEKLYPCKQNKFSPLE